MVYVWFALLILFIWMEASTVTMVSTWFAVGSLAALLTAALGGEVWLQAVVFLAVTGKKLTGGEEK